MTTPADEARERALAKALADTGRSRSPRRAAPVKVRRLPSLIRQSVGLVWASGPTEFATIVAAEVLEGLGIFAVLMQGNQLLQHLFTPKGSQPIGGIALSAGIFVAANLAIGFTQSFSRMRNTTLAELTAWHVQRQILDVSCTVELEDFDDPAFHDRLQRSLNSSQQRPLQLVRSLLQLTSASVGIIGVTAALFVLQPLLALIPVAALVPVWLSGVRGGEAYYQFVCKTTTPDRERRYLYSLLTSRDSAKEVRAFALGEALKGRWEQRTAQRMAQLRSTLWRRMKQSLWGGLGTAMLLVIAMVLLFVLTRRGIMSLASAATAGAALLVLSQRLMDAVQGSNQFFEAAPLVTDINDFLRLAPARRAEQPTGAVPDGFDGIAAENVSFAYPGSGELALHGVSIELRAGEVVALVGENGSGKTTLAKLLSRLYLPSGGRVLWNGEDTRAMDPDKFRRSVAVLFQDFIRYVLPASDNIAFGDITLADGRDAAVRSAAAQAGADVFLAALPKGYDTILGPEYDDGYDLSIGQWQRVALARAFFRDAPLVILDEPTASLDARAEHELFDSIRTLCRGRSVLLISHRFSTVRSADRIYVLEGGVVVEQGDHDSLMAAGGLYAELFRLQADAYNRGEAYAEAEAGNG
jgi:ATP-binding cassette subfamily B protein